MPRAVLTRSVTQKAVAPSTGPALRARLAARAASVRAYARPASRPAPAWYWKRVGVRHVERHSRLRSPDELAALHAPLDDGPRHADVRHPADAVACKLAADDEAQPPAQRGDDEGARLLLRARPHVAPLSRRQPVGRHREQRVYYGLLLGPEAVCGAWAKFIRRGARARADPRNTVFRGSARLARGLVRESSATDTSQRAEG